MRLGVCYDPGQINEDMWQNDAAMMRELGLKVVRLGEYAWSMIEPQPEQYNWGPLDKIIDILSAENLQVVLATPTSAPPVWMVHQHPEILPVGPDGLERRLLKRNHICPNAEVYRQFTDRLVSNMAQRYGESPTVIGWQIDHEFDSFDSCRCYCPECATAFRQWALKRYASLDELNHSWGTGCWSQQYSAWEQVTPPFNSFKQPNPSHELDYYRFCSESSVSYLHRQAELIAKYAHNQFVTHNANFTNDEIDLHTLGRKLTFCSWDSSPTGQAEILASHLYAPWEERPDLAFEVGDPYITGFFHAFTRGIKRKPYWVMQQQCGQISWGKTNPDIRPGALRLWTWHAIACGADAILFDHWRAPRFGHNQYTAGILHHDHRPDLAYKEIASMLPEAPVMQQLKEAPHTASVAILVRFEDLWAFQIQPHHQEFSYLRLAFLYFRALNFLGIGADLVPVDSDLTDYRLVISPSLFLADRRLVATLEAYVARGGLLLLGARSGSKTKTNLFSETTLPGLLRNLVGADISDWQSLPEEIRFNLRSEIPGLTGEAGIWTDAIRPDDNEEVKVWARYMGGPLAGQAAITEHTYGAGSAFYLGFYPLIDQLKVILRYLVETIGIGPVLDLPEGVIVQQRGNHRIAFNFTRNEKTLVLDDKLITLPPRDFRFFLRDWS